MATKRPTNMTKDELVTWARQIITKHDQNDPEKALFDALLKQPVSVLVRLVGRSDVDHAISKFVAIRGASPD